MNIYAENLKHNQTSIGHHSLFVSCPDKSSLITKYYYKYACLSVCPSVCPLASLENHTAEFHQIFYMHDVCGHDSAVLWRRCGMLTTSGVVDDVMFLHRAANGPESSTTLCFEKVRQVAVPVGRRRTTTVFFGRVHQNAPPGAKSAIRDWFVSICKHTDTHTAGRLFYLDDESTKRSANDRHAGINYIKIGSTSVCTDGTR